MVELGSVRVPVHGRALEAVGRVGGWVHYGDLDVRVDRVAAGTLEILAANDVNVQSVGVRFQVQRKIQRSLDDGDAPRAARGGGGSDRAALLQRVFAERWREGEALARLVERNRLHAGWGGGSLQVDRADAWGHLVLRRFGGGDVGVDDDGEFGWGLQLCQLLQLGLAVGDGFGGFRAGDAVGEG
uniref:(northern house mosquito) hypothetical protein n=1 Tax=Culex pipiens TaxID=7175 RepID=A0A8D8MR32_CULPI